MQPVEPKLMTAEEAREKIDRCEDEKSFSIWCDVVKKINRAIEDGQRDYSNDGTLPESVVKKLRGLGYKVTSGSQYNQSYYIIKW